MKKYVGLFVLMALVGGIAALAFADPTYYWDVCVYTDCHTTPKGESGWTIYWDKETSPSTCDGNSYPFTTAANGCYRVDIDGWDQDCWDGYYYVWAEKGGQSTDTVKVAYTEHDVMLCVPD